MIQGSANENDTLNNYSLVDKMENTKSIVSVHVKQMLWAMLLVKCFFIPTTLCY